MRRRRDPLPGTVAAADRRTATPRVAADRSGATDRASLAIVERIRASIHHRVLGPGDALPHERELCKRFGVGRTTVREAMRILEVAGLIEVRVGCRGGAFLKSASADRLGDALAGLLSTSTVTEAHASELRAVIETSLLPLIIERATDPDIEELAVLARDADDRRASDEAAAVQALMFHERLAECTHNPANLMLVRGMRTLLFQVLATTMPTRQVCSRHGQDHRELVRAIEARDLGHALRVMGRHLGRPDAGPPRLVRGVR